VAKDDALLGLQILHQFDERLPSLIMTAIKKMVLDL
jgi:hypothetical protein